ncbi:MAG: O-antigen ligase family protein [Taibaiella sp.]|nr:O-antigen ligase family protein [Taibaiella sp.]
MLTLTKDKWFGVAAFSVLFITVILWGYTGNYMVLAAPVAFLFFTLAGVNWKTAYWIFLATIPPSIQINFAGDSMSITLPDQPLMWVLLIVFIIIWARNPLILPRWWWKDKIVFIAVLQFFWLIVSVAFSKVLFFSLKFLLAKSWLMVCYFILPLFIFTEKKDFIRGFKLMMIPMLLTVIIILVHHAALGFRFNKVQMSLEFLGQSLYYNHVDYSSVTSMLFPLLLIAFHLTKGRNPLIRGGIIGIILIFIAGIIFAQTRAAYLAVFFGIVVGIFIRFRLVNIIMPAFYGLLLLMLVYMIPNNRFMEFRPDYNSTYMHKDFAAHMIATIRGKDMSSMERVYRWIAAIRMSKANPFTGVGPRGFYYYYKPYAVTSFRTYVSRNPEQSTTHNYYLYMLVEQGWPAMLLYALLIPAIFAKAQRVYHRFKDRFYRAVTVGLAMTIAAGFINNFFSELIETHKVGALFYLPVALLIILDKKSRDMEHKETADNAPMPVIKGLNNGDTSGV